MTGWTKLHTYTPTLPYTSYTTDKDYVTVDGLFFTGNPISVTEAPSSVNALALKANFDVDVLAAYVKSNADLWAAIQNQVVVAKLVVDTVPVHSMLFFNLGYEYNMYSNKRVYVPKGATIGFNVSTISSSPEYTIGANIFEDTYYSTTLV